MPLLNDNLNLYALALLSLTLVFLQRKKISYICCPKDVIPFGAKVGYLVGQLLVSGISSLGITFLLLDTPEFAKILTNDNRSISVFIVIWTVLFFLMIKPFAALIAFNNRGFKMWKYVKSKG